MIRAKKKAEEKKAAEAQQTIDAAAAQSNGTVDVNGKMTTDETEDTSGEVKLFGIDGKDTRSGTAKKVGKKKTPGEIRIQKDIAELDGGSVATVEFPNPNDLTSFNVIVKPDSGCWLGAQYLFTFSIPAAYPHEPPKVVCQTRIYHPNINLEGAVCLNILREDWKPVLDINAVIYGLIYLFYEPNPGDPLNKEAAEVYRNDKSLVSYYYKRIVINSFTAQKQE